MLLAGRPAETDLSPAAWLADAVRAGRPGTVAALVPAGYPAYARLLHPAVRYEGDDDVDVRWDEVAAFNGRTAHRLMQWPGVTGSWDYVGEDDQPDLWNDTPAPGHLPAHVAVELAALLTGATTTPDRCFFGACDETGTDAPRLVLPSCELLLLAGPITLAAANMAPEPQEQSPALWWPADRAWCVATDPELMSTYVGGPVEVLDALLGSRLEVHPARPDDQVDYAADTVNPVAPRT
ncbi:hypothetical protein [Trujillonella endophytica]|uniref:Uncharacterized protein n=1 Tax=Trujillonella endophytica TaxID=673521 RepID=A0A1H8RFK1_9ACTN|nr:hypothetical protein [Trujillella endophytica]SEO65047.1 hypothetical protein SAMN05660991_01069 [Trujillella endophytica]